MINSEDDYGNNNNRQSAPRHFGRNLPPARPLVHQMECPASQQTFSQYFHCINREKASAEAPKTVICFRMESRMLVDDFTNIDAIRKDMTESNIWLQESVFQELREAPVGWFMLMHPNLGNHEFFQAQLEQLIDQSLQDEPYLGLSEDKHEPSNRFSEAPKFILAKKGWAQIFSTAISRRGVYR